MKYQDNDFDEIDEMLFKYFKENKEVPQKTQNIIKNMNYNGKRNNFGIRKIAITILAITTLTTGGVFAQNIVSFFKNIFSLSSININNDSVVDAIEKENDSLRGVLPKNYSRPELDKRILGEIIDLFTNINVGGKEGKEKDILGRVYEYFLGKFAANEGKGGGEDSTEGSRQIG